MNPRDKHLLEVFQDLGEGESDPSQPPPEPSRPSPPPSRRVAGLFGGLAADPKRLGVAFAGAVALAFLLGIVVGRGTGDDPSVRAADGSGGSGSESDPLAFLDNDTPTTAAPSPAEATDDLDPFADAAAALADADNRYTVVAITYDRTDSNVDLAWSTAYHFADRGLPAGPPYGRGEALYILVGAASTTSELVEMRDRVRVQLDPAGRRRQYESAYIAPIDSVLTDR